MLDFVQGTDYARFMPTLARIGNIQIRIFAEDHAPPHFHVVTPVGEVIVRIADLQVQEGSIDRKSLRTAFEWASQNIELLEAEWSRLND